MVKIVPSLGSRLDSLGSIRNEYKQEEKNAQVYNKKSRHSTFLEVQNKIRWQI